MISSTSENSPRTTSYQGGLAVLYALGKFGQSLIFLVLSVFTILNGVALLGLLGPAGHGASHVSHWRGAADLVVGGCLFAAGVLTLLNKLNQKAD